MCSGIPSYVGTEMRYNIQRYTNKEKKKKGPQRKKVSTPKYKNTKVNNNINSVKIYIKIYTREYIPHMGINKYSETCNHLAHL